MKILLACLMCLVLTEAECFAIKGGPIYPAGTNVFGTYAGILEPRFDPTNPFSSNSLGLFSLSVPSTGLASGSFVMFAYGIVFRGTVQGLGNPNKGTIQGILDGSFAVASNQSTITDAFGFTFTSSTSSVTARAEGNLTASVTSTRTGGATSASLLKGTATLFVSQQATGSSSPTPTPSPSPTPGSGGSGGTGGVVAAFTLDVVGFKQSDTATTTTTGTGS